MNTIKINCRYKVFDHRLFVDDISTPLGVTMKHALVVSVYESDKHECLLVDVIFDYRPDEISRGHFASMIGIESTRQNRKDINENVR